MLLAVDVGNSHTVSGVFAGDELIAEWRLKSDRDRTGDELAIRYHSLFQIAGIDIAGITGFIVASVVPTLEAAWMSYAERYLAKRLASAPLVVNHAIKTDISIQTDFPSELGADRIVNAVAACRSFEPPLIVIDFGTAITFDCVNKNREYLGGNIHPGIGISLDALASRTAKLPMVDIDAPLKGVIGKNSVEAIRSGILLGFGGMVDRMTELLTTELSEGRYDVKVIATGGMGKLIAPYSKSINVIDPLLTLKGLKIIHDENATGK